MPSEETAEKDGIELGAINAKLLEKIEDLTLYLLQQSDALRQQEAVIWKQLEQQQIDLKAVFNRYS